MQDRSLHADLLGKPVQVADNLAGELLYGPAEWEERMTSTRWVMLGVAALIVALYLLAKFMRTKS
jgi:hypothetical protein